MLKQFVIGAAAALALAAPAKALVLDFTKSGIANQTASGSQSAFVISYGSGADSVVMTVSSNQGPVTFANLFPGTAADPAPSFCTDGTLACERGGAGVQGSKISTGQQILVRLAGDNVSAGYSLRIDELFFLNLIDDSAAQPAGGPEAAVVKFSATGSEAVFGATDSSSVGALAAAPTSADAANTSVLLFGAGRLNDTSLFSDYSLAGIRFSLLRNGQLVDTSTGGPTGAVPLPASAVFLLAGGLAGFGTLRLRSRRS